MNMNKNLAIVLILVLVIVAALFFINGDDGVPNLNREVAVLDSIPERVQEENTKLIKSLQETLKEDPENFNAWSDLAFYYHAMEDFEGAEEVWEYAAEIRPDAYLPVSNLARLYGYRYQDEARAVAAYREAISRDTTRLSLYADLAVYYIESNQDYSMAIVVMEEALAAIPGQAEEINQILNELRQNKANN